MPAVHVIAYYAELSYRMKSSFIFIYRNRFDLHILDPYICASLDRYDHITDLFFCSLHLHSNRTARIIPDPACYSVHFCSMSSSVSEADALHPAIENYMLTYNASHISCNLFRRAPH